MTLDNFYTKTTVEFNEYYKEDSFIFNGKPITGGIELQRVTKHLQLIRLKTDKKLFAKVASENNFPTASGIASSSSGFTALTLAACKSIGLIGSVVWCFFIIQHSNTLISNYFFIY